MGCATSNPEPEPASTPSSFQEPKSPIFDLGTYDGRIHNNKSHPDDKASAFYGKGNTDISIAEGPMWMDKFDKR
ncbi:hypothetical protein HYALB_00006626 [Hymenoscyphus albidus]|uniref:Uncharacterized protein n=1 Tax=Hymenoscyphus albidus TaxID=595503 RepID=A0A9N9QCS4_9HELO|nr:hypothetical protein HYALB_00006626 [Hymenoscyphus albidus]